MKEGSSRIAYSLYPLFLTPMPILRDLHGMPTHVPDDRIRDFLRMGYRHIPQQEAAIAPSYSVDLKLSAPAGTGLNPNIASLKELVSLPGVTTAIARKVISDRPYVNIEDLIAKVTLTDGDWLSLAPQLSFD
ncbi:MAG: hypothetical protein NVS2B14_06070 [Chamaesiphon sp.]